MTISFIFHSPDGSTAKHFQDMLEVEAYFGPSLIDGNVSDDGVQVIEPADRDAEFALQAYRIIGKIPPILLNESAMVLPIDKADVAAVERTLRLEQSAKLAGNRFVFRGQQFIELSLSSLCDFTHHGGSQPTQCREDVAIYIDHHSQTVLVDDLRKSAKRVGDLMARKMVESPSAAVLTRSPINEDSGAGSVHLDGLCVGPKELVVQALQQSFARRPHDEDMGGFDFNGHGISSEDVWPEKSVPVAPTEPADVLAHTHSRLTR